MAQTVWTESICDRCKKLDRKEGVTPGFTLPLGWSDIQTVRFWDQARTPGRHTLCEDCKARFNEWVRHV